MPIEELGTGRSEIRNRVLAPIFKDLKLIEAWGLSLPKQPRHWNIVKSLPKKSSGKIDKEALKRI